MPAPAATNAGRGRVIKVGGSLLTYPPLVLRLRGWLSAQSPAPTALLAGGGGLADTVRQWDACHRLPLAESHWLCIRLMDVSAHLLSLLIPEVPFTDRWETVRDGWSDADPKCWIVSVEQFLREREPELAGPPLAADWSVTSDSIAARLAQSLHASELVLLKSVDLPPLPTLEEAADGGYADPCFPEVAGHVPRIRWVNLRTGHESLLGGQPSRPRAC